MISSIVYYKGTTVSYMRLVILMAVLALALAPAYAQTYCPYFNWVSDHWECQATYPCTPCPPNVSEASPCAYKPGPGPQELDRRCNGTNATQPPPRLTHAPYSPADCVLVSGRQSNVCNGDRSWCDSIGIPFAYERDLRWACEQCPLGCLMDSTTINGPQSSVFFGLVCADYCANKVYKVSAAARLRWAFGQCPPALILALVVYIALK